MQRGVTLDAVHTPFVGGVDAAGHSVSVVDATVGAVDAALDSAVDL